VGDEVVGFLQVLAKFKTHQNSWEAPAAKGSHWDFFTGLEIFFVGN
jgi:hypothetical protein